MASLSVHLRRLVPSLPFALLCTLLIVLTLAGGASRAEVLGQAIVRLAAAGAVVVLILAGELPRGRVPRVVAWTLAAIAAAVALQLVPLPPSVWQQLPQRSLLAASIVGEQPWRPLSIQPGATMNALASLIVPAAVLVLAAALSEEEQPHLLTVLLGLVSLSAMVGLVQLSGHPFGSGVVNYKAGAVSGFFANRNHFALFLALGCLLAPAWATQRDARAVWRLPAAAGLIVLFLLVVLASGSRAGLLIGALATLLGLAICRRPLLRRVGRLPRYGQAAVAVLLGAAVLGAVAAALFLDRAQSVDRLLAMQTGEDMRSLALPTVLDMTRRYFPFGTGYGSFDTAFRIDEPFALLDFTYFNHAHDDLLEVVLDGGIVGALLLAFAIAWTLISTIRVWRRSEETDGKVRLARLGTAMLLSVFIASALDYPARTPLIMAVCAIAAAWLAWGREEQPALPRAGQFL